MSQPITGVQRYQHELLAAFDVIAATRDDLSIELLTPPLATAPSLRHIAVRQVGRRRGHAWEQLDLPRAARGATLFCGGNAAPIASLMSRDRVVVTVHDLSFRYFPEAYALRYRWAYRALTPLIMRRADAVITVSNSERRSIAALYPASAARLVAIQNGGLPVGSSPDRAGPAEIDVGYLLYVGSLSRRKNFPNLLEAAVRLAERHDVRVVFVGSTPPGLDSVDRHIPAHLRDRIVFLGQIDDTSRLIGLYAHARLFLFPSAYEASPLPPVEAMACGLPVIASDIPSLRERCGDAARYCRTDDPASIVAAAEAVLGDAAERDRLIAAGYARARRFDWMACARATLAVIEGAAA